MEKRMNLLSLTWPIFIENVLFMLLGFIDILCSAVTTTLLPAPSALPIR